MFNYKKMICCVLSATTVVGVAPVASNAADNSVDLQGGNRFETANKIALNYFKKADNVILVNSDAIPDALSVAPYAKKLNAPVLLTKSDSLDKKTKETLEQLNSKKIILIGGEKSLSKNLENNLKKDYTLERISGSDRINTSLQIANKMGQPIKNAFVVNGYTGLADAAGAGGIAAKLNVPLVFTDKNIDRYKNSLNDLNINNVFLIGGTYNLPEGFNNVVNNERIAGSNRRDTNAKLIEKFFGKDYNSAFIAKDGSNNESELIDSVTIGGVAGLKNMPIFLGSKTAGLTNEQLEQLKASAPKHIVGVGGGNKTAGNQIEKQLPNAQIDISEITSKPSEDEEVPSSGGGGGGGGGGSSTNTEQDKKNKKKEILSNSNTHLNTLVEKVAGNDAVSKYATISFDPDSMVTKIVSKEITKLPNAEDLEAISGTGFITGLKATPNLLSYSIDGKETVIKGENNESELKNSIISDVLAQFEGTDLNNIPDEQTITVTAKFKDGDVEFSQDYKFNFNFLNMKTAIEKEIRENTEKESVSTINLDNDNVSINTDSEKKKIKLEIKNLSFFESNSNELLENIKSIKQIKAIKLNGKEINIDGLDGETLHKELLKAIDYDNIDDYKEFFKSNQNTEISNKVNNPSPENNKMINNFIKSSSNSNGKTVPVYFLLEDETGEFLSSEYKMDFTFDDSLKSTVDETIKKSIAEQDKVILDTRKFFLQQSKVKYPGNKWLGFKPRDIANDLIFYNSYPDNLVEIAINKEKNNTKLGFEEIAGTGLNTTRKVLSDMNYLNSLSINENIDKYGKSDIFKIKDAINKEFGIKDTSLKNYINKSFNLNLYSSNNKIKFKRTFKVSITNNFEKLKSELEKVNFGK